MILIGWRQVLRRSIGGFSRWRWINKWLGPHWRNKIVNISVEYDHYEAHEKEEDGEKEEEKRKRMNEDRKINMRKLCRILAFYVNICKINIYNYSWSLVSVLVHMVRSLVIGMDLVWVLHFYLYYSCASCTMKYLISEKFSPLWYPKSKTFGSW